MTTIHSAEANERGSEWWVLLWELIFLGGAGLGSGMLIFSLLPVSIALMVFAIAVVTFPVVRSRVASWLHVVITLVAWFVLSISFAVLVAVFGSDHFGWLLDWS